MGHRSGETSPLGSAPGTKTYAVPHGHNGNSLVTSARTFREGATKKPLTGGELRNAGAEVALDGGEVGAAVQRVVHNLYIVYIQDKKRSQEQKHNANLFSERTSAKR